MASAHVLTDCATVHTLDLTSMAPEDAYFTADFRLQVTCEVSTVACFVTMGALMQALQCMQMFMCERIHC